MAKRKKGSGTFAGNFLGSASGGKKAKRPRTDTKNMRESNSNRGSVRFKRKTKRGQ